MEVKTRVGTGFDIHRLQHGGPLRMAGIDIPFRKQLIGHSDADVVAHAIIDALLGAAGMGDIGMHFPPTDESLKGANSIDLLAKTVELLRAKGYQVGNIDATIICEAPKLVPFYTQMRQSVATTIGVDESDVSIKAKTAEGIGIIGEGGAIATYAVALIVKAE